MTQVRLQKFLAECGTGSRRKMEQFIKEGRVRVNGQVVTELGRKIDPSVDQIEVNRRPVRAAPKGVVLLNKPRGVVSTLSDPEGRRTVSEFLTKHYASYFPVGRLDWDSTGLMILTNDGEMAERLMHPRFEFERIYEARVEGSVSESVLDKLRNGLRLSDGVVQAEVEIMSSDPNSTWVQVRIREGRNRVVRRVFDKLGHSVMKLKRTVYGPFKIGRLQVGQVRVLTAKEYLQVRHKVMTFKGESSKERQGDEKTAVVAPRRESSDRPSRPRGLGRGLKRPSDRGARDRKPTDRKQDDFRSNDRRSSDRGPSARGPSPRGPSPRGPSPRRSNNRKPSERRPSSRKPRGRR